MSLIITETDAWGQSGGLRPTAPPPSSVATSDRPAPAVVPDRRSNLDARSERVFSLQVALDRAGFSPGELDAQLGSNTKMTLRAFQKARGLTATGELDTHTVAALGAPFANPFASYAITAADVAGPFSESIPADMMEKSKLPALAYTSVQELLGERFHVSPKLLQRLNPRAKFAQGDVITVPNVDPFLTPGSVGAAKTATPGNTSPAAPAVNGTPSLPANASPAGTGTRLSDRAPAVTSRDYVITVTDRTKTLTVQNAAGEVIFHAPVTVGSENDPLPVGEWKVNGVQRNPTFHYNPDLFWDANPKHAKAKLAPGPNNPVGVVWIDLSKEHYGIHGTPEPSRIGHTESHGCIRLTNWDVTRLAALVAPGTKVILR